MKHPSKILSTLLLTGIMGSAVATAKPLKVYILAGQSNMVGHANVTTLPYMREDPATVALHNRLVDKDGKPIVHENVQISMVNEFGMRQGPLTTGFGAKEASLGPELAFGATMHEKLQEPILLIKTAWGGKNLHTDFRSPSAGPYVFNQFQKAMAAAADLPEFEGNVFPVHAGLYWDKLQSEADKKKWKIRAESTEQIKQGKLNSKDQPAYETKRLAEIHTPEEAIAFKGISNQPYHYLGSAKILSRIGEAFAETLVDKMNNK